MMTVAPKKSPYAVLEVPQNATMPQIDAAYARLRNAFEENSLATYTLFDSSDTARIKSELDEAYETLRDPARRATWDCQNPPEPAVLADDSPVVHDSNIDLGDLQRVILSNPREMLPAQAPDLLRRGVPKSAAVRKALQESLRDSDTAHNDAQAQASPKRSARRLQPNLNETYGPDTEYSGALLRRLRESADASLEHVSEITKIGKRYIAAIEDNDFDTLPAQVYVRGFVCEYARVLGLDPGLVAKSYMALVKRYRADGARH